MPKRQEEGRYIIKRVVLIVLDSLGVGALPDAERYGDAGSNTLGHVAMESGGLALPVLGSLGLGNIIPVKNVPPAAYPRAAFGKMAPRSPGKDTTTGHWEIAGIPLESTFPVYPEGFPSRIIAPLEQALGKKVLGNKAASGTEIIEELGGQHLETGAPIVYTSADSVFQIAAHEEVISVERLYEICAIARQLLQGKDAVARVIARPFTGRPGTFRRTSRRKDYSLPPPGNTLLTSLREKGFQVTGVGKVGNIFAEVGLTASYPTKNNNDGLDRLLTLMSSQKSGLLFVNLIDFDMLYGHRNEVAGYARALEIFDNRLTELLNAMTSKDLLLITADHGCDPTHPGTDHTREYVPLLAYAKSLRGGKSLGVRGSFADVAATISEYFGFMWPDGNSFYSVLRGGGDDSNAYV